MVYLDQAATSFPKIDTVKQAVIEAMEVAGNANRSANMDASRLIFQARKNVANFFQIPDFHRVILNSGNTESLNTCIKGILKEKDHVITTYAEHNSVLRPLYELEKKGFISLTICSPYLEDIKNQFQLNTRMVVMTHSSNVTGEIFDVQEIGHYCKEHGVLLMVDAAQSAGHIPVSIENIDILCFSGHKGLLGIGGIGGFCVKDIEVKPLISGGTGIDSFSQEMPHAYPEHLEAGTQNLVGIAALNAGVQYVASHQKEIVEKERFLLERLYSGLEGYVEFYSSLQNSTSIVAFNIPHKDSAYVSDVLNYKYGIITRCGAHCAPLMHKHLKTEKKGIVRLSLSFQNSIEDIDLAIRAIREISNDY